MVSINNEQSWTNMNKYVTHHLRIFRKIEIRKSFSWANCKNFESSVSEKFDFGWSGIWVMNFIISKRCSLACENKSQDLSFRWQRKLHTGVPHWFIDWTHRLGIIVMVTETRFRVEQLNSNLGYIELLVKLHITLSCEFQYKYLFLHGE